MLVYGDHVFEDAPAEVLDELEARASAWNADSYAPPLRRHGELVSMLVDAGALAQALLDHVYRERGCDDLGPLDAPCAALLQSFADAVVRSWRNGCRPAGTLALAPIHALRRLELPEIARTRLPEGFVFYALYPETYAAAAQQLPPGEVQCIGIRSIGVALAAVLRSATGSTRPLVTVRPSGHPFSRTVEIAPALERQLCASPKSTLFAIADEGPGLSGSSFAAVSTWLESRGIPAGNIHFFPSHPGAPGHAATDSVRAAWARASRHVASFDELFLRAAGAASLPHWAEDLIGPPSAVEDLSGGAWRTHHFKDPARFPAIHPHQERRKFLVRTDTGEWLFKSAGLGRIGARAFDRSRQLARSGFSLPVLGRRHGFLIQQWRSDARPLSTLSFPRAPLIDRVGHYLAFRARAFASPRAPGASVRSLYEMARYNTQQALGDRAAQAIAGFEPHLADLEREVVRIETDNRMQAWEWLVLPDGRLLKTDAVDHCLAHDLVGSQDVAWDIAGARIELGLRSEEEQRLVDLVADRSGHRPSSRLLVFNRIAYLAFQLGHQTLAADAVSQQFPEEARRLRERAVFYARLLMEALEALEATGLDQLG